VFEAWQAVVSSVSSAKHEEISKKLGECLLVVAAAPTESYRNPV
jgi:hypothetical protein